MSRQGAGRLAEQAEEARLRRVAIIAWRDLDDPEAGGSELHAHEIARRWAEGGIEVTLRTSSVAGEPERVARQGYTAVRRSGRYQVFATAPADVVRGRLGQLDGVVEIWNGMPFFSPLWSLFGPRLPLLTFLHHVHAEMWQMVLPPRLAALGHAVEFHLAPPLYRRSRLVTLSESSRREIVAMLRLRPERVSVVPPGVDSSFSPGGERAGSPLVLAVGRLVPVKRFELLVEAVAALRSRGLPVECLIAGEGSERGKLEAVRHELGADSYVHLPGRLSSEELLAAYRRAWVVASTSAREGWGMTVSEAAACATPAVVSRIAGHEDAVVGEETGLFFSGREELVAALGSVLADEDLRSRLGKGAYEKALTLTWDETASATLGLLAEEAARAGR